MIATEPRTNVSAEEIRALLVEIIEAGPRGYETRYKDDIRTGEEGPRCLYVQNDTPSCLIGRLFVRLGHELLPDYEGFGADGMAKRLGITDDLGLQYALFRAQQAQDQNRTWGVALERFDEALALDGEAFLALV